MNRVFINIFLTVAVIIFIGCNSGFYIVFPEKNNNISFSSFFEDTFDDETTGTEPGGYSIIPTGGTALVADTPSVSGKSLHFNDTSTPGITVEKPFTLSNDYIQVVFSLYPVQTNCLFDFTLQAPDWTSFARINFSDGGVIQYEDGSGTYDITSYTAGAWYKISIIANFIDQTYDVYIDDTFIIGDLSFINSPVAEGGFLLFRSDYDLTGDFYLDNLSILQSN